MSKRNRSYYCKKIAKALELANKDQKILRNELHFFDDLDWDAVNGKGAWTDVYLNVGEKSIFAFTISSSITGTGSLKGCVPEAIRDLETGLWNLYIHKKFISHNDVGEMCCKWLELQGPIKEICMGANVYFNETRLGHTPTFERYPKERITTEFLEEYGLACTAPKRTPGDEDEPNV